MSALLIALIGLLLGLVGSPVVVGAQDERATVRIDGRAVFRVGPTDDADAATRARQIERRFDVLLEVSEAIGPARVEPAAAVRIDELGPDGVVVESRFWTDSRRSDFVATASDVRRAVVAALREAEISLPDSALHVLLQPRGAAQGLGENPDHQGNRG